MFKWLRQIFIAMNEKIFSSFWYATKQRAESEDKTLAYDDKGQLSSSSERILFTGQKTTISIPRKRVKDISLVEQKYPYKTLLKTSLASLIFWAPLLLFALLGGLIAAFYLKNLFAIPICLASVPIMFIASIVIGIVIGKNTKWIKITYQKEDGTLDSAYFAESSYFGWNGILGRTKKIFEEIR